LPSFVDVQPVNIANQGVSGRAGIIVGTIFLCGVSSLTLQRTINFTLVLQETSPADVISTLLEKRTVTNVVLETIIIITLAGLSSCSSH